MIGLHQELGYSELERAGTLERNPSSEQTPVPLRTATVACLLLSYLARPAEEQGPQPGLSPAAVVQESGCFHLLEGISRLPRPP